MFAQCIHQGYIFWPFPPPGGGGILSKLKGKEKGKKSDKTHVEIPLWSLNTAKNPQKQGKNLKEDFMKKGREKGGKEEKREKEKREKSKKRMERDKKNG